MISEFSPEDTFALPLSWQSSFFRKRGFLIMRHIR